MENKNLDAVNKKAKIRLWIARITGIVCSLGIIAVLLCFYFRVVDEWMMSTVITILAGLDFAFNASIFELKESSLVSKINLCFSGILFLAGVSFVAYGVISGNFILF